jgi:hypothetical protein
MNGQSAAVDVSGVICIPMTLELAAREQTILK